MAITVDYSTAAPWLITIPKSDLTLITGTQYQLTVDEFWILLRDFTDNENPMARPKLYSRIPATSSTPSITTIDLNYYQLEFEDGLYSVNIVNGNTNIREAEVKNQVSVNTNNTTGFINPTFLEAGLFNGSVAIDAVNGVSGVGYTPSGGIIGTVQTPSDNPTDALTIAAVRGLDTLSVKGDLTVNGGLDYSNYILVGQGQILTSFTVSAAATVVNTTFLDADVTGTLDGDALIEDCTISGNLTFVSGVIEHCILNSCYITLGGGTTAYINESKSGVPGVGASTIDFGGSGQDLSMRGHEGSIILTNKSGTEAASINLSGGRVRLTSSVTNGSITCYGIGRLVEDATDEVIPTGTWNGVTIVNELIDSSDVLLTRKLLSNKVVVSGDDSTTTIYDDDGTTVLWTFNHTDARNRAPV
jgi:hypothetical protein